MIENKDDNNSGSSTPGKIPDIKEIGSHIYSPEEMDKFRIDESIQNHPLAKRPTNIRSKIAYQTILKNIKPTKKYLLPGQIVCFEYLEPKFKEDLEYYDRTPLVLFFGITRTENGDIREIGLNLHYFPPFARMKILNTTYEVFKHHFQKNFNEDKHKANSFISYKALKSLLNKYQKIAFGVKMYIPVLRSNSYVVPTRLLPTAHYTEGHFSKATLQQVFRFWRQFKR